MIAQFIGSIVHIIQKNASKWVESKEICYLDVIEFYFILKREILPPVTKGIDLEYIILSKSWQAQKDNYLYDIGILEILNNYIHTNR